MYGYSIFVCFLLLRPFLFFSLLLRSLPSCLYEGSGGEREIVHIHLSSFSFFFVFQFSFRYLGLKSDPRQRDKKGERNGLWVWVCVWGFPRTQLNLTTNTTRKAYLGQTQNIFTRSA
jgi:hypothetical protein